MSTSPNSVEQSAAKDGHWTFFLEIFGLKSYFLPFLSLRILRGEKQKLPPWAVCPVPVPSLFSLCAAHSGMNGGHLNEALQILSTSGNRRKEEWRFATIRAIRSRTTIIALL
jgi:hypothetical protein